MSMCVCLCLFFASPRITRFLLRCENPGSAFIATQVLDVLFMHVFVCVCACAFVRVCGVYVVCVRVCMSDVSQISIQGSNIRQRMEGRKRCWKREERRKWYKTHLGTPGGHLCLPPSFHRGSPGRPCCLVRWRTLLCTNRMPSDSVCDTGRWCELRVSL